MTENHAAIAKALSDRAETLIDDAIRGEYSYIERAIGLGQLAQTAALLAVADAITQASADLHEAISELSLETHWAAGHHDHF